MSYLKNKLIILLFLLTGCSSLPSNTSNSCLIFDERYLWYKHSKKVEKQSNIYKKQLFKCKNSLNKNKYIIF